MGGKNGGPIIIGEPVEKLPAQKSKLLSQRVDWTVVGEACMRTPGMWVPFEFPTMSPRYMDNAANRIRNGVPLFARANRFDWDASVRNRVMYVKYQPIGATR